MTTLDPAAGEAAAIRCCAVAAGGDPFSSDAPRCQQIGTYSTYVVHELRTGLASVPYCREHTAQLLRDLAEKVEGRPSSSWGQLTYLQLDALWCESDEGEL